MDLRKSVRDARHRVPRTILGLTWREHIGGRWAVSPLGFAIIAPVAFLAVLANVRQPTPERLAIWAAISLASLSVIAVVWWVASVTILRNRREHPAPVWLVVLIGIVSGAGRSATVVAMTDQAGLLDLQGSLWAVFAVRMATGAAQLGVGMPLLAMALSVSSRYRNERRRLLEQQAELLKRQSQEVGATLALREALTDPVRKRLKDLADRLGDEPSAISDAAIDVRGQAYELWSTSLEPASDDRVRFGRVVSASLRYNPLPIAAVLLVWFPSAFLSITGRGTLLAGAISSITGMLALLAVYVLGARIARARPSLGPIMFIAGTVLGGGLAAAVAWWFSGGRNLDSNLPLMTTSIVWLASITLVVSVVEGAVRQSESVIRRLREGIDAREVELHTQERQRSQLAQEVASVLHGVVQGRLAAAQRSSDDSTALARQALDKGIEMLGAASVATAVAAEQLACEVSAPWSALMDIEIRADKGMIPADRVRDVGDVLEECLSNAFRHGGATRVELELHRQEIGWLVVVTDDGSGIDEAQRSGLGTSLFEAVSGGRWSRQAANSGGCRVEVVVPVD